MKTITMEIPETASRNADNIQHKLHLHNKAQVVELALGVVNDIVENMAPGSKLVIIPAGQIDGDIAIQFPEIVPTI